MLLMMVIVLIFLLLKLALPDNALIGTIAGKVDVGLVAFCFTIIALLFDLAPQKEVIARVPWNTILMIAGAGMLIAVAVKLTDRCPVRMDRIQCTGCPDPTGIQLRRCVYELLQFHDRRCCTGIIPADPGLAAATGLNPASLCLHDPRRTEQRDQPVLIRRKSDPRFLWKRGRPQPSV